MPNRPRLTYANVVSTLALFLAAGGGAAYAADKIHSSDIAAKAVKSANLAPGAVHTSKISKRAITSGKLAVGAVRSNQIGDGVVSSRQIGAAAVAPSNLQFPVFYVASPGGGSASLTNELAPYAIAGSSWTQNPGQIEVVFGAAAATLAYDGSGSGSCRVFIELSLNGKQVGGGEVSTESTSLESVEQSVGAQPQIDPLATITNHLTARTGSNGDCTADSKLDSTRFRVLDFG
jgi:trimeric autotransporter adhesin